MPEDFTTYVNRSDAIWRTMEPHTTLVVACYRVAQYLPFFLSSLDAQNVRPDEYELIFVIDGCPESSEAIIRAWMTNTKFPVRVISKPNGGVASARNLGISYARGAWVSSPDPDDVLSSGYLHSIEDARADYENEHMFVGRIAFFGPDGRERDHPLGFKYDDSATRLIDLTREPDSIHTLGGVVFFRRQKILVHHLKIRTDLPTASDADFIMRYLLATGACYILVPQALYRYQRRSDNSSIVASQETNIKRNVVVFGVAHRALLNAAGRDCPQWLANTMLYFAYYLFRRNRSGSSPVYATDENVLNQIADAFSVNLELIGASKIRAFRLHDVLPEVRAAWIAAADGNLDSSDVEEISGATAAGLQRVAFYSSSREAPQNLQVSGASIVSFKARSVEYLNRHWVYQHVMLLRTNPGVQIFLRSENGFVFENDGKVMRADQIRRSNQQERPHLRRGATLAEPPARSTGWLETLARQARRIPFSLAFRAARLLCKDGMRRSAIVVLIDHDREDSEPDLSMLAATMAGSRHDVVIVEKTVRRGRKNPQSATSSRVKHRSIGHFLAMKRASIYISDHLEPDNPFSGEVLSRSWLRGFLLPSSLDDRFYWTLNSSDVDFLVSRRIEQRMDIARDGSRYRFSFIETAYWDDKRRTIDLSTELLRGVDGRVGEPAASPN